MRKKYAKTEQEADKYVAHTVATFAFEGIKIPLEEQKRLKDFALGKISRGEILSQIKEEAEALKKMTDIEMC